MVAATVAAMAAETAAAEAAAADSAATEGRRRRRRRFYLFPAAAREKNLRTSQDRKLNECSCLVRGVLLHPGEGVKSRKYCRISL